jgi:hypothetical protein
MFVSKVGAYTSGTSFQVLSSKVGLLGTNTLAYDKHL